MFIFSIHSACLAAYAKLNDPLTVTGTCNIQQVQRLLSVSDKKIPSLTFIIYLMDLRQKFSEMGVYFPTIFHAVVLLDSSN